MTKACLHIGLNKTGSSSIQKWLETNALRLRAQRVVYERLRCNPRYKGNLHAELCAHISHEIGELCPSWSVRHTLGIKSIDDQARISKSFMSLFEAAVKRLPSDSLFILSSEHLTSCVNTAQKAHILKAFLERFFEDLIIVVYIRRQEDFIPSEWSQLARFSSLVSLDEFIKHNPVRDYSTILHPFQASFGTGKIAVRLAFPDTLSGKSPVEDFKHLLKIDQECTQPDVHENQSPSAAALELLRSFTKSNPSHFRNGYMNPNYRIFRAAVSAMDNGFSPLTLTRSQAGQIRQANLLGNRNIRDAYFPDRKDLFIPRSDYPEVIDIQSEITQLATGVADYLLLRPRLSGYRLCRDFYETYRHSVKINSRH